MATSGPASVCSFKDAVGEWTDCTEMLKATTTELATGELCQVSTFSLYDAISALELMDPKMDSGMVNTTQTKKVQIKSHTQALDAGLQVSGFSNSELVHVMDKILSLVASWLHGHTLAQTVFTCLYLHDPTIVQDDILKPYCIGALKVVDIIRELVQRADVYEEEDFQASAQGFYLCEKVPVLASIAELNTQISFLEGTKGDGVISKDTVAAQVCMRLRLMSTLLSLLNTCTSVAHVQKTVKLCRQLHSHVTSIQSSLLDMDSTASSGSIADFQHALENGSPQPFQPFVNSHLLSPTPPREIEILTTTQMLAWLLEESDNISAVCGVGGCNTLRALDEFFLVMDRRSPGLLARSTLVRLVFGGDKILNRHAMPALVQEFLYEFDHPIPLESASLECDEGTKKELLDHYCKLSAALYQTRCRIFCNNSARRRRKLAKFLSKVQTFYVQAHDVNTALHALWSKHDAPLSSATATVIPFATRFAVDTSVWFLLAGFDLQLYARHEFHMIWWYVDYLLGWYNAVASAAFNRIGAAHVVSVEKAVSVASASSSKKNKKSKSKKAQVSSAPKPSLEWHVCEIMRHICKGLLRAMDACKSLNALPQWTPEFNTIEVLYQHRFAPLEVLESPEYVPYARYRQHSIVQDQAGLPAKDLFNMSTKHFDTAIKLCVEVLKSPTQPPTGTKAELQSLSEVARSNMTNVKYAMGLDGPFTLDMKFIPHRCFPVFTFQ
eukprot:m.167050 g.167050  ORF g.167050 m.167050 type:complete len:724 (+) comp18182_c0_seq1:186-2357(+)